MFPSSELGMIAELQERYRVDEDSFISLYHILTYKALSKVSMFLTILPISNTGGSAADILVFCTPNLTPFPTWSTITSTNLLTGIWKVPNHVSVAPIILGFPAKTNVSATTDFVGRVTTTPNCVGEEGSASFLPYSMLGHPPPLSLKPNTNICSASSC